MRNSKNNRTGNKIRTTRPPRTPERNCITDGVYSNNYFMHAATSQVGEVVKVETVQGLVYEGIFKTFSQECDIVLELAHKIDLMDPQKLNAQEVVDNLIFRSKDIVYMVAQNTEPNYAVKGAFQTDANISKYNGEISGEKKLQPWDGPPTCNGEECDLEGTDTNQNGWDAHDMFLANEQFGVQSSYDDSLADYTCQIHRKDTKDFKEEEAKAARIAMEIERNPSSQARSALENGENEEELYASVLRPANETDEKYVPPPMKRKSSQQHHRPAGNSRGNYSANGNRTYSVQESPVRQQMNNSATLPRYHHQTSQQYHQQPHGNHSQTMRENTNRTSPENKNIPCASNLTQSQNIPSYSTNLHQQQRSFSQNVVSVPNHAPNVSMQQSKISTLPNGNSDYQSKQLPQASQAQSHQYHNQNQPSQNSGNSINTAQRKHHHHHHHQQQQQQLQHQHHHSNTKVHEEQINELKKFGSEFNLSYENKNKDAEPPKQIQVITSRNKSPPVSQTPTERTVINVTIVPTLSQNKYTSTTSTTQQSVVMYPTQKILAAPHTQSITVPQSNAPTTVPTTQNGMKPHTHVMSQSDSFQHQQLHLQQREPQVLLQHQSHMQQQPTHPQPLQPPILQQKAPSPKPVAQQLSMHQTPPIHQSTPAVLSQVSTQPQASVQLQQHPTTTQNKTVINSSVQNVHSSMQPQHVTQSQTTQTTSSQNVGTPQTCVLPPNIRPPLQQQPQLKNQSQPTQSATHSPPPVDSNASESENSNKTKVDEDSLDDVTSTLKKSTLNPNAKEFVYNPTPKSFASANQRSPSTPTQSRPHTPQTPSGYNIHAANAPVATGIQMVMPMPTYVVASPGYPAPLTNRLRKVTANSHRTPEFHPSNIPVSAVTGQPLLAPSVTLAPSPLGHGTTFPIPNYSHHPQLAAQHYPHVQMIRMVQQSGMVPLVPSTISYHDSAGSSATAVYVNHGSGATVAMAPHAPHVHHPQQHPPPSTAPSPSQTPQGPSQSHTPNNYQHSPLTQNAPPYQPIMCPVIQAPPSHGPPHHMVAAQAQPHAMQQYLQHQQVAQQPHIQVSLIPHSCS